MSYPFGKARFGQAPWSVKVTPEDIRRWRREAFRRGIKKNKLEPLVEITPDVKAMIEKAAGRKLKFE
ncbi:MAG TPA: hypothetical protein VG934_02885 [Candidatus Paceibacterota bacterium]|nr:hypothetical protein [Candidatus Paceibacterota bacterium]